MTLITANFLKHYICNIRWSNIRAYPESKYALRVDRSVEVKCTKVYRVGMLVKITAYVRCRSLLTCIDVN